MKKNVAHLCDIVRMSIITVLLVFSVRLLEAEVIESSPLNWRTSLPQGREVISNAKFNVVSELKVTPNQQKDLKERFKLLANAFQSGLMIDGVALGYGGDESIITRSLSIESKEIWWAQSYHQTNNYMFSMDAIMNSEGMGWLNTLAPLTEEEQALAKEHGVHDDWGMFAYFKRMCNQDYKEALGRHRENEAKKFKSKYGVESEADKTGGHVNLKDKIVRANMLRKFPSAAEALTKLNDFAVTFGYNFLGRKILIRTRWKEYNEIADLDPHSTNSRNIREFAAERQRADGWTEEEKVLFIEHMESRKERYEQAAEAFSDIDIDSVTMNEFFNALVKKDVWTKFKVEASEDASDDADNLFLEAHRMADPYPAIWGWAPTRTGRRPKTPKSRKVGDEWELDISLLNSVLHSQLNRYQIVGNPKVCFKEESTIDIDATPRECYVLELKDVESIELVPRKNENGQYVKFKYFQPEGKSNKGLIYVSRETGLIYQVDFVFSTSVAEEGKMIAIDQLDNLTLKKGSSATLEVSFKVTSKEDGLDMKEFFKD